MARIRNVAAGSLAGGAALIHLAVVPEHAAAYLPFGAAFAVTALLQAVVAIALVTSANQVRRPAIALSLALVAVWLVSRTTGLPVGPHPCWPEPVGVADLVATAFELGLVAVLLVPVERFRAARVSRVADVASMAWVPLVGVIGLLALIAVASLAGGAGHRH